MKEFLVLIPTTKKLVGITDITEENKDVVPVVCVSNELKALPISSDYKNFIQNPTGVVEKLTEVSSYRIDLTDEINSGTSWQLGFAIAHLLKKKNKLLFSKNKNLFNNTSNIIWASGKLNTNLDIIEVDHITPKLENSLPQFKKAFENNLKVFICVSKKNFEEVNNFFKNVGFFKNIEILKLDNLKDLLIFFGINIRLKSINNKNSKYFKPLVMFSIVLLLTSLTYIGMKINSHLKKYNEMIGKENFLIEINKDRNSTEFLRSFAAFLFSYIQNFERLGKNNFLKVQFIPLINNSTDLNCNFGTQDSILSINASCQFLIEISNVSSKQIYLWIYKKNNFQNSLPLERSFLDLNDKLILEKPLKGFEKLILVFGEKVNNEVEEKLNNMRLYKNNIKIENQLERFSTLGYGYKVYEFFNKISIERTN